MTWYEGPLVGLDFETTGVDPLRDLPVQAALVFCNGRGGRRIDAWIVDPRREVPAEAVAIHGISTERARREGRSLEETARHLHRQLDRAVREGVAIVAMNASFDVTIAECLFARVGLHPLPWRRVIDPLVLDRHFDSGREGKRKLDALCETYGVVLEGAHDAGHDAAAAIALARKMGRKWRDATRVEVEMLTVFERSWHRQWASRFHDHCCQVGRAGLDPADFEWPIRVAPSLIAAAAQFASESRTTSMSASVERGFTTAMRTAASP